MRLTTQEGGAHRCNTTDERLTTATLKRRMIMAIKHPTTSKAPWRQSSNALNDRLCEILRKRDDEDSYLFFARRTSNTAVVSAAFGAVLAAQRESIDLTQTAVAERALISVGHLRAIERGRSQPSISVFLSICEVIGTDPRELFNRTLERLGYPIRYIPVRSSQPHNAPMA